MARREEGAPTASAATPGGTESADRVADVLLLFARSDTALGVTEIARLLGLNKTVVHRILQSLSARSLVRTAPHSSNYVLGAAAIGLGTHAWSQMDIRPIAAPVLRKLRTDTGETTTLSVLVGRERIYLDQYESPQEVKMVVEIGPKFPLHSGASSRAILAFLGESFEAEAAEQLSVLIPSLEISQFRVWLADVRCNGYAVSLNERNTGAASVAAPIFDSAGHVLGSISASGPVIRYSGHDHSAQIRLVVEAAHEITALLGS